MISILLLMKKNLTLKSKDKLLALKKDMKEARINWKMLRYHKTQVFLLLFDILIGQFYGLIIAKRMNAEIIHVRSYIRADSLPIKWITGQNYYLIFVAFGLMSALMEEFGR